MQVILFAQPYDIAAMGISFSDIEGYRTKASALRNAAGDPVEEFEIQFIGGDAIDAELIAALLISQAQLDGFFAAAADWDDIQKTKAIIAGRDGLARIDPAADDPDDLDIDLYWVESLRALAEQFLEDGLFGPIPDALSAYIDTDAIARDLAMDFAMIDIAGARIAYRAG